MAQLTQDRSHVHQMRKALPGFSYPADWFIEDDEPVSQSPEHQRMEFRLQSALFAWQERTKQENLLIRCETACRWDRANPKVGVSPDVYITEKPPNDPKTGRMVRSIRTWQSGHYPPRLAIEIVSHDRPKKDYRDSPHKHGLLGTKELWVFDPELCGYTFDQAPVLLQVFKRAKNRKLRQVHAGEGPFRSDALDAWVRVVGGELVISDDLEGQQPWLTLDEVQAKRAEEQAKRADEERQAKEAALAELAQLKAELAKRGQ